jgi:two-component system, cell cycle sensor histidine kinase and response regulator CckA
MVPAMALAGAPPILETAWQVDSWDYEDGLPQSTVTAVAPSPDGALWVATFGGLSRFDGRRFDDVPAAGAISRLTALAVGESDPAALWLGSEGDGVWRLAGGEAVQVSQPEDLQRSTVYRIVVGAHGEIWVASTRGSFHRDADGGWAVIRAAGTFDIDVSAEGWVWACQRDDIVADGPEGQREQFGPLVTAKGASPCVGGTLDPDGDYWSVTENGLLIFSPGAPPIEVFGFEIDGGWSQEPLIDAQGRVWVSSGSEIIDLGDWAAVKASARAGQEVPSRTHDVPGHIRAVYGADGGSVWLGTVGRGLARVAPTGFSRTPTSPKEVIGAGPLAGDGRDVWFSTNCLDLQHAGAAGKIEEIPLPPTLDGMDACLRSLQIRSDGSVLVARSKELLEVRDGEARLLHHFDMQAPDTDVTVIAEGSGSGVWYGTRDGELVRLNLDTGAAVGISRPVEDTRSEIFELLVLDDGQLIVGHALGVSIRQGEVWTRYTADDGLAPGAVRHVALAPSGTLWVATYGGGLGWIADGTAGRIPGGAGGVRDAHLSSVFIDSEASVWLQGNDGVTRVGLEDLEAARTQPIAQLPVQQIALGEANGWLRPSASLQASGLLWLAGVEGVTVLNTHNAQLAAEPLAPTILAARVGEMDVLARSSGPVVVPADGSRRFEVTFTTASLLPGQVVWYEHRLRRAHDHTDVPDWVVAGRERTAVYGDLGPGLHTLEVRSTTPDARVGPVTSLQFVVAPLWTERALVRYGGLALAVTLAVGIALAVGQARTRAAERRNRALQDEISQRKIVEAKLQERKAWYREVFTQATNAFLLYDESGRCLDVNPEACRLFGAPRAAMLAARRDQLGLATIKDLDLIRPAGPEPLLCNRLDGERFPARVDHAVFEVQAGRHLLTSVMDLSALVSSQNQEQRLREQLFSAQRLEVLGRLAGGVAHDMNNVLAAVATNVELIAECADLSDPDINESVVDARDSVQMGASMVQQLLAFGRNRPSDAESLDPVDVVEGLRRLLLKLLPGDRRFEVLARPGARVHISRGKLEQVVLNLVLNASDAAGQKGRISVRVGPDTVDPDTMNSRGTLIDVEDDGPGIPADDLEQIFDPYFTTKEVGKGTGLGLLTVRSVVEGAGGRVDVRSVLGVGTCFSVRLPGTHVTPPPTPEAPTKRAQHGDGRLLMLVDDDPGVRRSVNRQLTRSGFRVVDFEGPEAALAGLAALPEPPALLVTDVIMPGLNGRQLASRIRDQMPDLPVLFISGFTADVLGTMSADGRVEALLQKPFTREALLLAVQDLLHQPPPST